MPPRSESARPWPTFAAGGSYPCPFICEARAIPEPSDSATGSVTNTPTTRKTQSPRKIISASSANTTARSTAASSRNWRSGWRQSARSCDRVERLKRPTDSRALSIHAPAAFCLLARGERFRIGSRRFFVRRLFDRIRIVFFGHRHFRSKVARGRLDGVVARGHLVGRGFGGKFHRRGNRL